MNVEFFAEAFNIFNRTRITGVNTTFHTLSGATLNCNSSFGTVTQAGGTLYRERRVQLAGAAPASLADRRARARARGS